jgi:alpha-L-rhamnosidase
VTGELLPPFGLAVDGGSDPHQVGRARPTLAWQVQGPERQRAYEVRVSGANRRTETTGRIQSSRTTGVPWPADPIATREQLDVSVRAWLGEHASPWSEPLHLEASLLEDTDWQVDFVSPSPAAPKGPARPAYLLRAVFDAPLDVQQVRAYVTAHGVYELEVNGARVGNDELAPGWTSYEHRLRFQAVDLTAAVVPGRNAVGAWLADGWYRGLLGFNGGLQDNYGPDVALLLQLELTLTGGQVQRVPLEWRYAPAPITAAGLYEGETYDARTLPHGWSTAVFDDRAWLQPQLLPRAGTTAALEPPMGPPVRVIEQMDPVTTTRLDDGRLRYDFGQNIAGRVRIAGVGRAGQRLIIRHAEVLTGGELALRPLRNAAARDEYVFAGGGSEEWAPRFTFHGFRYAEISGWEGASTDLHVQAEVMHSEMPRSGWFDSSHELLNKLHSNTVWGMRGNFIDLPTDCPQRDERLGWTGDIQVFAPAALYLYDSAPVLRSWLRDLDAEQKGSGAVPNFVPWIACGFPDHPTAAWGDAAVIVPWSIYEQTGDVEVLRRQYRSMTAWVDLLDELAGPSGVWNQGFQLGDWLDPAAPYDNPGASQTDKYLVATAYFARSAQLLAQIAALLDLQDDATRYAEVHARAVRGFRTEFVSPSGRVVSDTPTALALALRFDLLQSAQRAVAGARLRELVIEGGHRIQTGFVGTPIICDALADTGSIDTAYHLLLQQEFPSWLYPVTMGATTVWERWDSMLPDGEVNPGEMTSFNHYALGAVVDFMHRRIAGLAPAEPGYRLVRVAPEPSGGLTRASARHNSPLGPIEVAWQRTGATFQLTVEIPTGGSADVLLPGSAETLRVEAGRHTMEIPFRPADLDPAAPVPVNPHEPKTVAEAH